MVNPEGAAPVSLDIFWGYVEMFRYARRKLSPRLQGSHFDKSDMLNVLGMFLVNRILFDSHRMKVGHSFIHSFRLRNNLQLIVGKSEFGLLMVCLWSNKL